MGGAGPSLPLEPEVRPETHPAVDVPFRGVAANQRAIEQSAVAAERQYIDASVPVHRQ
jgi:hypothetical protein